VVISLRSIFDLIRESRISHPVLCHKVLKALLDILQNLPPESLLSEPANVVGMYVYLYWKFWLCYSSTFLDPLFELLLDISTCNENEGDEDQGKDSLASISASCLLSLVIAWGITPKLLQSLTALIVGPRSSAMREIAVTS
jgi:RCR-type E3 ubiquitin transferase